MKNLNLVKVALLSIWVVPAVFMFSFLVVSLGCEQNAPSSIQTVSDVSYKWDTKHQLCFAATTSVNGHFGLITSITYVPLNEERCR